MMLFGLGLSTGLSGAMIPGPLFLYTVSEAFRSGQVAGLKIALGHLLLEVVLVAIIIFGLREALSSELFRSTVARVGGIGLIAMGGLILAKIRYLSLSRHAEVTFRWGAVLGGGFFSLASPGFLIWWATIGASVFLKGALSGIGGIALVGAGHALADLIWHWFIALSVERGRSYCSDSTYRAVMVGVALSLIGLGFWLPRGA